MVAEGDDSLMETFFSQGNLTEEQMLPALRNAIRERKIVPVLFAAAGDHERGVEKILDEIVDLLPGADSFPAAAIGKDGKTDVLACDPNGPVAAIVFKTISDPFTGRLTLFRVHSGTIKADGTYWNANREVAERFGPVFSPLGKQMNTVPEVPAGDIGVIAKLKETLTGDTLSAKEKPYRFPAVVIPEPAISFSIEPKSKGDEDKISIALAKLTEEDPSLKFHRDADTSELLLSGAGQLHVEIAVARMKRKSNVEVILHPPKVPYRETITRAAEAHGRHKKQTGGHGQFADCKIRVKPLPRGSDFEFVDDIFGGSIPRNYIPAVEKGIQDARKKGYLAGYPMVDFRVELFDGQYHDVDSSEMAFKIAGSLAFKDAMEKAKPTILEPIMKVDDPGAAGVHGRPHGRPDEPPRPPLGHGPDRRRRRRQGRGPALRDALLLRRPPLAHAGPGLLHDGALPLRGAAPAAAGEAHRRARQGAPQGRRRGRVAFPAPGDPKGPRKRPLLLLAPAVRVSSPRGSRPASPRERSELLPRHSASEASCLTARKGVRGETRRSGFPLSIYAPWIPAFELVMKSSRTRTSGADSASSPSAASAATWSCRFRWRIR